jgi:hypothetical protein
MKPLSVPKHNAVLDNLADSTKSTSPNKVNKNCKPWKSPHIFCGEEEEVVLLYKTTRQASAPSAHAVYQEKNKKKKQS